MISALQAQQQYEWAAQSKLAQAQMDFQREMSNTAHQREVEDLKAAGLNPVLSAGGSGASTPNGASADLVSIIPQMMEAMTTSAMAMSHGMSVVSDKLGGNLKINLPFGLGSITMPNEDAKNLVTGLFNGLVNFFGYGNYDDKNSQNVSSINSAIQLGKKIKNLSYSLNQKAIQDYNYQNNLDKGFKW